MIDLFRNTIVTGAALAALAVGIGTPAHAAVFTFDTDPFAGSDALSTPGRQIVGGEPSIAVFDIATDVLALNSSVFDFGPGIDFFSGIAADLPTSANFVVLQTLDADGDANNGVLLNAGLAADLVAGGLTVPGAGFFIYFNSGLDLPRLVYSTDLSSSLADLKILARFTGLNGPEGRAALPGISVANVAAVPEPASWALMIAGFGMTGTALRRRAVARPTSRVTAA